MVQIFVQGIYKGMPSQRTLSVRKAGDDESFRQPYPIDAEADAFSDNMGHFRRKLLTSHTSKPYGTGCLPEYPAYFQIGIRGKMNG